MACQFVRYGIDFVIVEKNETITPYSKALGVQARTLEIFDQIGLAVEAVGRGAIAERARLLIDGEVRGELDFSNIGKGLSPFPFVLMLEQSKTEQLLYGYLQSHKRNVLWKTELEAFSAADSGIRAQLRSPDGASQIIEAKYLVGCDGPKSLVRQTLGLAFEGSAFERILCRQCADGLAVQPRLTPRLFCGEFIRGLLSAQRRKALSHRRRVS